MPGNRAALLGYRSGSFGSRMLPTRTIGAASRVIGTPVAALMKQKRAVVAGNLRRVLGDNVGQDEVDRAVRDAFCYYIHYWMESFKLPYIRPEQFARHMSAEGFDNITKATSAGRGVILALPHLGSWDYAGAWMASIGYPMTVVAEPLDPPELFDWFARLRRSLGLTVVAMGPGAAQAVLRALREGKVVGLLSDRDLLGTGVEVKFFGERTTFPAGPATLALRSGAALLPTGVYTEPRGQHHSVVRPPISLERSGSLRADVARITQDLAHGLEHLVRRAPGQWHLFQPNWPSDGRA
ncbi:MAG: phosphatidylinositol mannoside acyltransferase [Mycobacterium sp.]